MSRDKGSICAAPLQEGREGRQSRSGSKAAQSGDSPVGNR
jgi:hypothetical protein